MLLLDSILLKAFEQKASDLHISYSSPLFIRRFGSLLKFDVEGFSPMETESLITEVLNDKEKELLKQKEDIDFSYDIPGKIRCRGNIFRQVRGGLDASFRLISTKIPDSDELGLPDIIDKFIDLHQGLVLLTGPAGSGKTTTLAYIVDSINKKYKHHILTIEDPVEYVISNKESIVNQREIGKHTHTFEHALRSALREDPDVIVIGELRDMETVAMALKSAETGHLVFGTLHTKDASSTVTRIVDVFPPDEQPQIRTILSESLKGILSQTLIPRVDNQGMALAYEILLYTPALSNLIREDKTYNIPSIIQTGKHLGMTTMKESIENLIQKNAVNEQALKLIYDYIE
ncbi:MAG: PilT/PilU family type 4a pilus ATPase [Candidatus Aureabacteria bacterium]|nr:PilT/PilU family type 4a pilus ATPase [Candidatus Auribacterota bacterium]